jgi:hypothetical protein
VPPISLIAVTASPIAADLRADLVAKEFSRL